MKNIRPILPNSFAETLRETIDEWPTNQKSISRDTGILESHLSEMKHGKRKITPEYDLRLSRFLGIEPEYFLRLQMNYELQKAQLEIGEKVAKEVIPAA